MATCENCNRELTTVVKTHRVAGTREVPLYFCGPTKKNPAHAALPTNSTP